MPTHQYNSRQLHLPRLEAILANISAPVIVLEAPAGFGKTHQGKIWADKLASQKDQTVSWFEQKHYCGLTSIDKLMPIPPKPYHWIFIDEAHLLDKAVILKLVDFVVQQDSNMRLVLMQRYNSALRLATHRLKKNAVFIEKDLLAFTQDETRYFLQCSKTKAIEIHQQFQGWPAAIILMGSIGVSKSELLNKTTLNAIAIFWEMIEEEVIYRLPEDNLQNYIDLSTLTNFDIKDAQNILSISLEELKVLTKQLTPIWLNNHHHGSLHPCVREGLQRMGWMNDAAHMKQLHMKACQYFWDKGELVMALEHAYKSGHTHYVCELIEEAGGLFLWLNEGLDRIQQAMSFTDAKLCEGYPRLMLIKALLHVKEGSLDKADSCWNLARKISHGFTHDRDGGDVKALQDESRVMGALLAGYGCHSLEEQISAAQPLPSVSDTLGRSEALKGYLHTIMCLHALQSGQFQQVRRQAALSESAFETSGSDYGILYLDFHRGGAAYGEANLIQAQDYYDRAERRRRRLFVEDEGLKFIGKVFAAELKCETGAFLSVKRKLTRIRQQLNGSEAWFDVYAAAIRSNAYLIYLSQGYKEAALFLELIGKETKLRGLKRVQHYADTLRLELACRAKDKAEADRLAKKLNLQIILTDKAKLKYLMWREYVSAVIAHSLYMNLIKQPHLAKPYLEDIITYGQSHNNQICKLYALATFATLFSGPIDNLAQLIKETGCILPLTLSSQLRESFKMTKNYASLALEAEISIAKLHPQNKRNFTAREHEIIYHLAEGLADKEIATQLNVSVHTVRFHIKNIFKKTGEHDRNNAVMQAKRIVSNNSS